MKQQTIMNADYSEARDLLASKVQPCETEQIPLEAGQGRILAEELKAGENVPAFDRSPYDGYAFRAEDTQGASHEDPCELTVIEEIPAGSVGRQKITCGTAAKILTGAPIPDGADAVVMFEKTEFTERLVRIFAPVGSGENIIYAGEDVRKGQLLAPAGTVIDPGLAGSLAGQGIYFPRVYRKPEIGIISTGSELREETGEISACEGAIRNTNRYTFAAALQKDGCITEYLGTAGDDVREIADLIEKGLRDKDLVLLTGGVSVGDYDLTPQAMELAGCELLIRGVSLKPGMACCYGIRDGRLVCALSGNPSSSLTNYYMVLRPAIRRMTGLRDWMPEMIRVTLAEDFRKKSRTVRVLKGKLSYDRGTAVMLLPKGQGNVIISSTIGCDVMAVVPEGSGALEAGTQLEGFMV